MTSTEATLPAFDRSAMLERLATETFDVLVVGGGITGAGVALDAASRGLRTALVERNDFASGTSSKSSKMVHGGLRYLQQHDFRLVYEALHERQRLLENAPHLVSPLPFFIPLFGRGGTVDRGVARAYSTALWLYDLTGGIRIGERHKKISKEEALRHFPTMRTEHLVAGFLYLDARADDARLTLAIARSAAIDFGAAVANYVEVRSLLRDSHGKVVGASASTSLPWERNGGAEGDTRNRGIHDGGAEEQVEIRSRVVVNATGVWADELRALDEPEHPRSLRPAKGVHVSVPASKLPADFAAVVPVRSDRRSIFVVPWPDGGDVYIGTTDTDWDGSLDDPDCTAEDVDYLLGAANAVVTSPLSREDVTGAWAGLRPLLARSSGGGSPNARTADLSRRHTVRVSESGMVTVTGGKLTTYRRMAEDAVDAAVSVLGPHVPPGAGRSLTRRLALRGASDLLLLADLREPGAGGVYGIDDACFASLVARHGTETPDVLAIAAGRPELLTPLVEGLPHLRVEAIWAARQEMAVTLDDILSRRTRALLRRAGAAASTATDPSTSALLAGEWKRSAASIEEEGRAFAVEAAASLARAGLEMSRP